MQYFHTSCFLVKFKKSQILYNIALLLIFSNRDHFYQYGEIRTVTMVPRQQCAFVQFTTRSGAEQAAERSFNKLIIAGRRLNIKWGRSHGQQGGSGERKEGHEDDIGGQQLEPVPGLPGGKAYSSSLTHHHQ